MGTDMVTRIAEGTGMATGVVMMIAKVTMMVIMMIVILQ